MSTEGAPTPRDRGERFFIDHNVIHDRLTGKHVAADFEDNWQMRLLDLLNEQEDKIASARNELIAAHERELAQRDGLREALQNALYIIDDACALRLLNEHGKQCLAKARAALSAHGPAASPVSTEG